MNACRVSGVQTLPQVFSASEYSKSGSALPAFLPPIACRFGPTPGGASAVVAWQAPQIAKEAGFATTAVAAGAAAAAGAAGLAAGAAAAGAAALGASAAGAVAQPAATAAAIAAITTVAEGRRSFILEASPYFWPIFRNIWSGCLSIGWRTGNRKPLRAAATA